MNKAHCFIDSCENNPISVCNCEANPIPICKNHIPDHSQLLRNHKFIPISSEVDENTRLSLIDLFSGIKSDIKANRLEVINQQSSLIKQIQKKTENVLSQLNFYDQQLTEIISEICSLKEIDNSKSLSFVETLLSKTGSLVNKIRSPRLSVWKIEPKSIANLFNLEPIEETFDFRKLYRPSTQIIKFTSTKNRSKLTIYDAETSKFTKTNETWTWDFGSDGIQCLLPNDTLFCAYNYNWLTVDPIGRVTPIYPYRWNLSAGAIYVDEQIYLFGGKNNISAKYLIKRKEWSPVTKFSISIGLRVSCALFKNKILIGSTNSDTAFYDILVDSYSEIWISLSENTTKVFAVKNEKVILFEFSQFVYESDDNLTTWKRIGDCSIMPMGKTISNYPLFYKEKVFVIVDDEVYSFDLKKNEWNKQDC